MSAQPYVEPAIRTIVGAFIVACGALVYLKPEWLFLWLSVLLFVGFNLFQSGFTKFCMMEKMLRKLHFRSELDEIRTLNKANAEAEARAAFYDTLGLLNEVVIELSCDGKLAFLSDHWFKLLGCSHQNESQFIGRPFLSFINNHDRGALEILLSGLLEGYRETMSFRFRMFREDGQEHWVEGKFALYRKQGKVQGTRGVLRDVTDTHVQEKRITHMAMHDALTGLPNRMYLDERISEAIERSNIAASKFALLFIDLDNFKRINDLHGHKTGDQLLVRVSDILRATLRETDVLARWGGDEFVVLLPFQRNAEIVRKVVSKLMDKLQLELEAQQSGTFVTLSIGIAVYPDDAHTGEALLVQADKALFHAKSQGRNNIQMFGDLQTHTPGFEDVEMTSRFVAAVKENKLQVHYQPVMDAGDHKRIVSVEALARWHDDKYGWVSPATFIPLAENIGLINEAGRQVMEQALDHFSQCSGVCAGLKLAINVSKRQLMSVDFYPMLLDLVGRYGMSPTQIKLEITESIALDGIEQAKVYLQRLSDAGFTLSLDDFGTGFSSLSHVHELPLDEIKIDISFVRRIRTPEGAVLVKTIVDMGHAMQLALVAEGVEDLETATILQGMGVEMLQGYHFSRPMPKEECAGFIAGLRSALPDSVNAA
ncbi:MAG: EAL domain-containing protein [Gammaproteobacteria bacterium]|nr:EAL domain-containing protein [Gammaproteobacteria bacterium]